MTNEIAIQAKTDLVISAEQTTFTETQLAALRQLGVDDAPAGDIAVFFHQAKRTGLDPFAKQIYMIGRKTKVGNSYETRYTIQIGIDGYRLNARRAAERDGDKLTVDGPYWAGDDGVWRDMWIDASKPPAAAKFTVFRNGEAFTGVAMYHEYVQTYWNNDEKAHVPNSMWSKMPANQLAKCAEAAGYRRAYPDDFAGLVLEDAAQVIDPNGEPVKITSTRPGGRGVDSLRARAAAAQSDAEPAINDPAADTISALFEAAQCTAFDDQLIVAGAILGREVTSGEDIGDGDMKRIRAQLVEWRDAGELGDKVRDALNEHDIKAEQAVGNKPAGTNGKETK